MGGREQACPWPRQHQQQHQQNLYQNLQQAQAPFFQHHQQQHAFVPTARREEAQMAAKEVHLGGNNGNINNGNPEWSRIVVRAVGGGGYQPYPSVIPEEGRSQPPQQQQQQYQQQPQQQQKLGQVYGYQQQYGYQSQQHQQYYQYPQQHQQYQQQHFTYQHQLNYHQQLSYQQQLQRHLMMRRQQRAWAGQLVDASKAMLREEEWVVDGSDGAEEEEEDPATAGGDAERTEYMDPAFVRALRKDPETRTARDLQAIFVGLRGLSCPALPLRDSAALRSLCHRVRYERRHANDILFYTGEAATCWYILLSGSVFIDGSMFLPRSSFGKRTGGGRRPNECFVLEPSEMMVIDYAEGQPSGSPPVGGGVAANSSPVAATNSQLSAMNVDRGGEHRRGLSGGGEDHERQFSSASSSSSSGAGSGGAMASSASSPSPVGGVGSGVSVVVGGGRPELYQRSNRSSHSSDTSSAYSGSDAMQSVQSSLDADEVDLSGLVESVVDSDEEEDLAESIDSLTVRDTVRECLEKDPSERGEEDIETLLEFTQHLKAFTNMTLAVRRALCSVMVFAVVEKAGTIVMNDGEELDSWSVLINGHVEVEMPSGETQQLHLGDSFGITPTMDKLHHKGIMRTRCDDCQFVCITQADYYRILHQGEENTRRHEEGGTVVMVTEQRGGGPDGAGSRRGHIVIRGTPERLMLQLIEENSWIDPTYVEDFLLTHRSFIESPIRVAGQLLEWYELFNDPAVKDRVTRVVLLWVNNHFTDFETDPTMMAFLEEFEMGLEREKMQGQLRLLNIACSTKAKKRTVTLARPTRDEVLHFSILGGYERGFGIFISKVEKASKAEDVGLKRGDQVLEVNGQSFEHVSHAKALEVLRGTTHLSITVKSNLLAFKEMLQTPENSPRPRGRKASEIARLQDDPRARLSSVDDSSIMTGSNGTSHPDGAIPHPPPLPPVSLHAASPGKTKDGGSSASSTSSSSSSSSHKGFRGIRNALNKIIPRNAVSDRVNGDDVLGAFTGGSGMPHNSVMGGGSVGNGIGTLPHSRSNPDLTGSLCTEGGLDPHHNMVGCAPDYPEHVLKVYKPDQTCKYLLVHKETTAHEVVMLALQEFGLTEPSSHFSLCEVSVTEQGFIKRRRLPDTLQNLAERIGLSSRYYLKTNDSTETLVPDELAPELLRESQVHFLQLNAVEVATQLTLQDFSIFRQIESTEYVDDLFELKSRYGTPMLSQFAELVNREMFWVVTEVCSESNPVRRSKIIKQFIKVARQCKECKNFNSMFAIISGLGHGAVSRLRQTWEKLPSKYVRLFSDLQDLMDPSRNMSKYRQLVSSEQSQPPIIPFYPVVKKDLTFIHLGNDSRVEGGLVNFEKLRMIAKEVRTLTNMCSSPYDLLTMLERGGQPPSSAMAALNQLTTGATHAHHSQPHPQGSTVKRRKKSTATPNPKKMFEEAQMVRRVKAYLNNMKVISDEDKLHSLSSECEPGSTSGGGGSSAPSSVPVRKRHPSPTLSTASSTSSTSEGKRSISASGPTPNLALGPKFGAASPQALRKMMALSEPKTRPHQPRHPPPPPTGAPPTSAGPYHHASHPFMTPHHMHHHGMAPSVATSAVAPHLPFTSLHHSHHHMTSTLSPTPSPGPHRRTGVSGGRATHERSHSDTPTTASAMPLPPQGGPPMILPQPVDLSAESSSVTSLSNLPNLRRAHASVAPSPSGCGSLSSSPSSALPPSSSHSPYNSTDFPGPPTTHHKPPNNGVDGGVSSGVIGPPPPVPRRCHAPSPPTQPRRLSATQGGNSNNVCPPPLPREIPPRARRPPDYPIAAQMARMQRLGRAHSHEGVACYHTGSAPDGDFEADEDDDDDDEDGETQVSAV
ncbi:rap guanine nucleotide exchange factor 2 [Ischnura elegans]|uniref:rap guanine nucleotide exchange factor 2 n=1 Tax=Ischnura elegans TaxID=197161 RepID=UPI001ED8B572|nr:rap guanine nucleotide exchange factor 2 [Ischnura elegans]